jgi:hypothetical protein
MHDAQYFDAILTQPIRQDIGQSGHNQLPRTFRSPEPPVFRMRLQPTGSTANSVHDPRRCGRAVVSNPRCDLV